MLREKVTINLNRCFSKCDQNFISFFLVFSEVFLETNIPLFSIFLLKFQKPSDLFSDLDFILFNINLNQLNVIESIIFGILYYH